MRVVEVINRNLDLTGNSIGVTGTLTYSTRQWRLAESNKISGISIPLENSVSDDPKTNNLVHLFTWLSHQLLDSPMIWTNAQISGKLIQDDVGDLKLTNISQITANQKHVTIALPRTEDLPTTSSTILQDISQDLDAGQSKSAQFVAYLLGKPAKPETEFFIVPDVHYRNIYQPERQFVAQITDMQVCELLRRLESDDPLTSGRYSLAYDLAIEGIIRKKPDKVQFPLEITTVKQMRLFGHNYIITSLSEAT